MSTMRIPVVYYRHAANRIVAYLLQPDGNLVAYADAKRKAKTQLQDAARHAVKTGEYHEELEDPQLLFEAVTVRPGYPHRNMAIPAGQTLRLRLAVVKAVYYDTPTAFVPILDLHFFYDKEADFHASLSRAVQAHLASFNPTQVSRLFLAGEVELDKILVQQTIDPSNETAPLPQALSQTADHLDSRDVKRQYGNAWCREAVITDLVTRFHQDTNSLLLLGPSGSGKTTVLVQAARTIKRNARPDNRENNQVPRFWMTRAGRILAGMKYLGEWEARLEQIIEQIQENRCILCFDSLIDLVRLGAEEPSESIAAFLLPYLKQGELRLVVEATAEELQACRRLLPAFADVFDILALPDFDATQRAEIMRKALQIESERHRFTPPSMLDQTVDDLFQRFKPYHPFPAEPVRFLAELFEQQARRETDTVTVADAVTLFLQKTGLPKQLLDIHQPLDWAEVYAALQQSVVAQDAACRHVADVITTFKAGLNDPARPLGVFLMCGPTGVGKTECAKATAAYLFGHGEDKNQRLIRLDMSEYAQHGSSWRLLSKSDGLSADWLNQVRRHPFSVVLFDEIEKAAPDVFDMLLGLLDEGRLKDRYGRATHFNSTIIMMTSNIGTERTATVGYGDGNAPSFLQTAMKFFRPEFVNRIDHIVPFPALSKEAVARIAAMHLAKMAERDGIRERGITLSWSEHLPAWLCERGYDARYGARPLKRAVEQAVINPIARFLVAHPDLAATNLHLECTQESNEITVQHRRPGTST